MSTTTKAREIPNWALKADYVEACNCDYGCPCNFSGFPTGGFCRALVLYHIRSGNYGEDAKLDGLDILPAYSWPKAIHEGNGTFQLFITKNANGNQRQALTTIFSGEGKGDGPFALFANTIKYFLEPQFVHINANIAGKRSSFSIPGILDVQIENFTNPITGQEQDTKIQLPEGFIWKLAEAAKSKIMRISTANLNFDDSGKNAFYSTVEFKGP